METNNPKPGIPIFFPTPVATGGLFSPSPLIWGHVRGREEAGNLV